MVAGKGESSLEFDGNWIRNFSDWVGPALEVLGIMRQMMIFAFYPSDSGWHSTAAVTLPYGNH